MALVPCAGLDFGFLCALPWSRCGAGQTLRQCELPLRIGDRRAVCSDTFPAYLPLANRDGIPLPHDLGPYATVCEACPQPRHYTPPHRMKFRAPSHSRTVTHWNVRHPIPMQTGKRAIEAVSETVEPSVVGRDAGYEAPIKHLKRAPRI